MLLTSYSTNQCETVNISIISEYTYSYDGGGGMYSVGMNPHNFVTQQIPPSFEIIASKLHVLIHGNKILFNLETVNTSMKFNHCYIIVYYAGSY